MAFCFEFHNEERVFWVDRQSDRIVVGAKRLATVKDDKRTAIITPTYFMGILFETSKDPKWSGMGRMK